jgi:S1-C subfamily serine protease
MRSWIGTGIVAAVGGAIAAAALVGTGVVGNRNSSDASSSPGERAMTPQAIYERAAPGVVHVSATTTRDTATPFFVGASRGSGNEMTGSGFVLSDDGLIVTNAHLIACATALRVTYSDRSSADARLLGSDPDTDLALLQVDTNGHDLRPLELGDSHTVHVGDPTVAVGSADAQSRTLTTGHVSATRRRITAASGFGIDDVIQTDGVLNSGNAGGPLLDAQGEVIGVNSEMETGRSAGVGFAVPIDTAKAVLPVLQETGHVERAYLGVAARSDMGRVTVDRVQANSPAARAGVRSGDRITHLDGRAVGSMNDVAAILGRHTPGDVVGLVVERGGGPEQSLEATLEDRPATVPVE